MSGDALAERRANVRALAKELLTSTDFAILGRDDLVIRNEQLLSQSLDRIMTNVESWIDGDEK